MSKIVIVGPAHPYRGGIAAFSERLAREFIAEGHEVLLYTFTLQYPSFLFPGKTQYSTTPAPDGLKIVRCLNSVNPFNWIRTGISLRRLGADRIVFAFWLPYMAPAFGTVARLARSRRSAARMVGLVHNLIPHEHHPGDRLLARYFCGAMDSFVAMSHSVMEDLRMTAPSKPCSYSPHPLYDNFGSPVTRQEACMRLGLDPDNEYLLFFGLVRAYKGLDWLLEAFADKRLAGNLRLKLVVAGEFYGDGTSYLEQAERLGLSQRVIWRSGFIPDDQVRYYFCASSLVVQPYKTATQSGVTQIAYHFDRPMLVTRVGGLPEVVPDGKAGYCVEPSVSAIADAIADFAGGHPDFAGGVADEKKKYSWKNMARAVIKNE